MKLIVINKQLKDNLHKKGLTFYYVKKNDDFADLEKLIDKDKPNEIISIDFGIQINDEIENGSIIVAKDTININAKPVNWSIPREDRWNNTSEDLNRLICNILEKLSFEHFVGSGIELENSKSIEKNSNAKNWLQENIKGIYIDNNSSKLNELFSNKPNNYSIIRIMNSSFPLYQNKTNNFLYKIISFIKEFYFYRITAKKTKDDINKKKLISEISKI